MGGSDAVVLGPLADEDDVGQVNHGSDCDLNRSLQRQQRGAFAIAKSSGK